MAMLCSYFFQQFAQNTRLRWTIITLSAWLVCQVVSDASGAGEPDQPAHTEARIDQVIAIHGLTGEGTVFAMIDRGIDYRHTDFIDALGNTRIAFLFDMLNPAGANDPNNPYGVGTIFTEADINASLQAGGEPLSTDRAGHGTATTGIAVGDGSGTVGTRFRGVADKAKIIVIKAVHDAFPPFADQPGQAAFFDPTYLPIALDFAADKIEELDLPGVAVLNLGSIDGPTDGTSSLCQAMDAFTARGHVLVCGTGDDGGADNHQSGSIALGQTLEIPIDKAEAGNLRFELWYSEDDRFNIAIERPNGSVAGPFQSPPGPDSFDDHFLPDLNYFHRGKNQEFFGATSHRRLVLIDFFAATGVYRVRVTAASIGLDGGFHATLNPSTIFNNNRFLNPVPGTSISDLGSANTTITPGDYVVDNNWIDIDGIFRENTGQGEPGELWLGSSIGPTQAGSLGTDFVAPGEIIRAPYMPNTFYSHGRFNLIQNGNELYGVQDAVSAANPLVAGVVCLIRQADPDLTPAEIKDILKTTSRPDAFTGPIPNATWGHGKMDALAAVELALGFILGDVNGDGVVNLLDVTPFVAAITGGPYIPAADINRDGAVNLLDVAPFVALLTA